MIKNINKFVCLFLSICLSVENCYAVTANFISQLVDNETEVIPGENDPYEPWKDYNVEGDNKYQYRYKKTILYDRSISINAYNMAGISVMPTDIVIDSTKYKFKAGTWIGVNVTEKRSVTWGVSDFQYQEIKKKYICNYTKSAYTYECGSYKNVENGGPVTQGFCDTYSIDGYPATFKPTISSSFGHCNYWYYESKTCSVNEQYDTHEKEVAFEATYTCPSTLPRDSNYKYTGVTVEEVVSTTGISEDLKEDIEEKIIKETRDEAKSYVMSRATGEIRYITNNTYPADESELDYQAVTVEQNPTDGPDEDNLNDDGYSGYVEKSQTILEKNVCLNLKNSQVSYGRSCTNNEIKIENATIYDEYLDENVTYWHYFIPLNTTSNSEFTLNIVKNPSSSGKFPVNECEQFMEENLDDYTKYIVPNDDNKEFLGDYNPDAVDKTVSTDYNILKEGNGCYISTTVMFPITQEFYNEVDKNDGTKKLKGFNFYYRPIDINNPFPNEILGNSLWSSWDEDELDISESYDEEERTYIAAYIDASEVRDYNEDHTYTSWSNMNINGTSNFITNEGIVKRISNYNVYKLGCGPANADEESPLYLARCDNS